MWYIFQRYTINVKVNNFVLIEDMFMPEMHLRQSGFMYSACGPFTSNKEKIEKFKQTVDSQHIFHNKLDKACFQHDIAYEDFKGLTSRTASDKVLCYKAFNIVKNFKWHGYQYRLVSVIYRLFDKKFSGGTVTCASKSDIKSKFISNQQLLEESHTQANY